MSIDAGYVYFMQRSTGGLFKIGRSIRPLLRLENLRVQTGWPDLRIRAMFWDKDAIHAEKNLHSWCYPMQEFVDYPDGTRSKEWYRDTIYVRRFMYLAQRGDPIPRAMKPKWIKAGRRDTYRENPYFRYFTQQAMRQSREQYEARLIANQQLRRDQLG